MLVGFCYGWIDGVRRGVDAEGFSIRFTPRQAPSYRRQALHRVTSAKRPETWERRLELLVSDSGAGLRIGLMRRPGSAS